MPKSPVLDPMTLPPRRGSGYPEPYRSEVMKREKRAIGDAFGLKNFGVNLVVLEPGGASSQRHWHSRQDELVYVLEGEVVLVTDAGERVMGPGMAAGFPAGVADGHRLLNRTSKPAKYLEVGDRMPGDEADYPDIDLRAAHAAGGYAFTRKDGTPY